MLEPPPSENVKALTMELEVKYLFSTSSSRANFFIYQLPEDLRMKRILVYEIGMQKNPQTSRTFSGFSRILIELCGSKVQLALPHGNFSNSLAIPEIIYFVRESRSATLFYKSQLFSTNFNYFLQTTTFFQTKLNPNYKSQLFSTIFQPFSTILHLFSRNHFFLQPCNFFLQSCNFFLQP